VNIIASFLDDHPNMERLFEALGGTSDVSLGADVIAYRLVAACILGWLIGQVYRRTYTGQRFSPTLPDTHLLLCLGGAIIWLVVGDNLVRAFGLAGTIGLIRYRTIVRDPKDTTILLFSMVMGMSCGLGQMVVAFVSTAVVLNVLILLHYGHRRARAEANKKTTDLLGLFNDEQPGKKDSRPPKQNDLKPSE
jgi:uncharacterized membrane protein YhiD involved in acid resistance